MVEKLTMPRLFLTMEEGVLLKWYKSEGEKIEKGEIIFTVEADKATQDVESPLSGILGKILVNEGETIDTGSEIALIFDDSDEIGNTDEMLTGQKEEHLPDPIQEGYEINPKIEQKNQESNIRIMPKYRKMALDHGINLDELAKQYKGIMITEKEINVFLNDLKERKETKGANKNDAGRKVKISNWRKAIANKMQTSLEKTAQLTNGIEVDVTCMLERIKDERAKGSKVSFTSCMIAACAKALKVQPEINCKYLEEEDAILLEEKINIGFAVDTEKGLLVPVIKNADKKEVQDIAKEVDYLANQARQYNLSQNELSDGTFTVSNVGMFGVNYFTPIINYPESAILGIGAAKRVPAYINDSNNIEPRYIAMLNLTYDHKVIDGAPASRFLCLLKDIIEKQISYF